MDYPSIQIEDTDQTYFDLCHDDELQKMEEAKNILTTKKFLERIMKTEQEIENSLKKASKQRKEFVDVLTKEIEKEYQDQCAQIDKLCDKFKQDNSKSRLAKIQRMKELLTKIDNDQEIYKTKKISEMQKELNSVLLKMKTPDIPPARHSMIDKPRNSSGRGSFVNTGSQKNLQSSMFAKFKIQGKSKDNICLEPQDEDQYDPHKRRFQRGERTMNIPSSKRNFTSKLEELQQDLHKNLSKMKKSFVDIELKQVEKDITSLDSLNYSGAEKLTQVLKSCPDANPERPHRCQALETWKSLKPITLYEIIKNSESEVDFNNLETEYLDYVSCEFITNGLFKKDSECEAGIARVVYKDSNQIKEGQFAFGKLNGYGRICFHETYAYYLGMLKDDMFNGPGKLVHLDGTVQQGIFKENQFLGQP